MRLRVVWIVFAILAWGGGSAFWYDCRVGKTCGFGRPSVDTGVDRPLLFEWSSLAPILGRGFPSLRDQVLREQAPDRLLEIVGSYYLAERNDSRFSDLGTARAARLRDALADVLAVDRITLRANQLADTPTATQRGRFEAVTLRWVPMPTGRVASPASVAAGAQRPGATTTAMPGGVAAIEQPAPAPPAAPVEAKAEPKPEPVKPRRVTAEERVIVQFDLGSLNRALTGEVGDRLKEVVRRAHANDQLIVVSGHTDNTGDEAANMQVGMMRAQAIREWVAQQVPEATRLRVESRGPTQPLVGNDSEEGRARNRRVEVTAQ